VKIALLTARLALIALILLLPLVLLAANQRPVPPLDSPGFAACALPCWAGIIPGETRTLDAPQVMASQFADAEFEFTQVGIQINFSLDGPEQRLEGVIYDDRGIVSSYRMMMRMPLWQLMDVLGTPQCISSQTYPDGGELISLWWINEDHAISSGIILLPPPDWNPSVYVFTLASFTDTERCSASDVKPWRGFTPLWFYKP
jgi:hypothetical protein